MLHDAKRLVERPHPDSEIVLRPVLVAVARGSDRPIEPTKLSSLSFGETCGMPMAVHYRFYYGRDAGSTEQKDTESRQAVLHQARRR